MVGVIKVTSVPFGTYRVTVLFVSSIAPNTDGDSKLNEVIELPVRSTAVVVLSTSIYQGLKVTRPEIILKISEALAVPHQFKVASNALKLSLFCTSISPFPEIVFSCALLPDAELTTIPVD